MHVPSLRRARAFVPAASASVLAFALSLACGSSTVDLPSAETADGGGSAGEYTEAQYCTDDAARTARCGGTNGDPDECKHDYACARKVRPEARDVLVRCLASRECNTGDDGCYAEAARPFANELGTYVADCLGKREACANDFAADYCAGNMALGGRAVLDAVKACFARPCAEVRPCFDAALAPLSCK